MRANRGREGGPPITDVVEEEVETLRQLIIHAVFAFARNRRVLTR